ncbi:MAG: hypothetical protein ACWIPH_00360 [Ostreibacterium sp.]
MNASFLELKNDLIHLIVAPQYGARVIALVDLKRGRNWLVSGPLTSNIKGDEPYDALAARGWDECFPNMVKTDSKDCDHGLLWGRPHECYLYSNHLISRYQGLGYYFERTLILEGNTIEVNYRLKSVNSLVKGLPYLWSQHCLLACFPGEIIRYRGIGTFNPPLLTKAKSHIIGDIKQDFCQKTYAPVLERADISVGGVHGYLSFSWQKKEIAWCGLWLNYGGWPKKSSVHQVAIEPTTSNAESPNRNGKILKPSQEHSWHITISLHDNL